MSSRAASAAFRLPSFTRRAFSASLHPSGIDFSAIAGSAPTVAEATVNITFVNFRGERRKMSAFVGESLLATAARHQYSYVQSGCYGGGSDVEKDHPEGNWVEPKYGQGASCYHCHVVVGKAHAQALPRMKWDEQEELDKYPLREDITDTSRLACQITVTPQMEGMLVYVPDGPPVCNI